jgi:hypothetical protein
MTFSNRNLRFRLGSIRTNGQPMQIKRLGNGSPTMRSRAKLTGV